MGLLVVTLAGILPALDTAEPLMVTGRVTDTAGRPIEGAKIRPLMHLRIGDEAPAPAFTDEDGLFWMELPAALSLSITKPGYFPQGVTARREAPEIEVALARAAELQVRAVDENDKPVAAAQVFLLPGESRRGYREFSSPWNEDPEPLERTVTDGGGAAVFSPLHPGLYSVRVEADGFRTLRSNKLALRHGSRRLTLRLEEAVEVQGHILDVEGKPIDKARAGILSLPRDYDPNRTIGYTGEHWTETDEEGAFRLVMEEQPAFAAWTLIASAPGHAPLFRSIHRGGDGPRSYALVLRPGAVLGGRVLDPQGGPVPGVRLLVTVRPHWKDPESGEEKQVPTTDLRSLLPSGAAPYETDPEGRFLVENLPAGTVSLRLWQPGHPHVPDSDSPNRKTLRLEPQERHLGLELTFDPAGSLRGFVEDPQGDPVSGATVGIPGERHQVETEPDGRFLLGGLEGETLEALAVTASGFGRRLVRDIPLDREEPLRIRLQPAGSLAGSVWDAATGSPVSAFAVRVIPQRVGVTLKGAEATEAFSSPDGTFLMEGMTPGTYTVEVHAEDLLPETLEAVEIRVGEERPLEPVHLEPGREIWGRVLSALDGAPLPDVAVRADKASATVQWQHPPRELGRFWRTQTDEEGGFRIGGIPAAEFVVVLDKTGFARRVEQIRFEEEERSREIELRLGQGGSLEVTVLDETGRPRQEARVIVSRAGEGRRHKDRGNTNAQGKALFDHLPAGSYEVRVLRSGLREQVEVKENERAAVVLQPEGTVLFGELRFVGGPLEDLFIALRSQDRSPPIHVSANPTGSRYELEPLPPGNYTLRATGSWKDPASPDSGTVRLNQVRRVQVPEGRDRMRVDVDFPERWVRGRVVRAGTGEGVDDVLVVLEGPRGGQGGRPVAGHAARSESDGRFEMLVADAGEYTAHVRTRGSSAPGWVLAEPVSITVPEEGSVAGQILELSPGSSLRGRVVDADGRGIEGARVQFLGQEKLRQGGGHLPFWVRSRPVLGSQGLRYHEGQALSPYTDSLGDFRLVGEEPGRGILYVAHPAFAPAWVQVTVEEDRENEVDVVLTPGGALEITLPDGWADHRQAELELTRPGLPASILISRPRSTGAYQAMTAEGNLLLPFFPPGTWTVRGSLQADHRQAVAEVREGGRSRAELTGGGS